MRRTGGVLLGFALAAVGCASGGQYGYARTYAALGPEEPFLRRASREAVLDEVQRMPERFHNELISWFGVVTDVQLGGGGQARITAQLRAHQERHLCEDETEGSCRVTVSEADGGPFAFTTRLRPDDEAGENRIQPGALIRVYGTISADRAAGPPVLQAQFYRHWPRGQYVTTAARGNFLR